MACVHRELAYELCVISGFLSLHLPPPLLGPHLRASGSCPSCQSLSASSGSGPSHGSPWLGTLLPALISPQQLAWTAGSGAAAGSQLCGSCCEGSGGAG